MPLPTPDATMVPAYNGRVLRMVKMMQQTSLAGKTGILYDVMQGFQKGNWSTEEVRQLLMAHNDLCNELLDFTDGGSNG